MARLSMQAGPMDDWDDDMEKERQTSTALPIGNAVDLEAELEKAGKEGWSDGADYSDEESSPGANGEGGMEGDGAQPSASTAPPPPPPAASSGAATKAKSAVTLEDFEVLRVIGKGSFGKVFLVQRRDNRGTVYAMKVLKKDFVKRRRQIEHTRTERKVLGTVKHPFIVAMHFAFQTQAKL